MDIKCIALDLDSTTLNLESRLSSENRKALEYAISKGVQIVVASGRAFATLPEDILTVPGIEYAITSNGAAVYHLPTGKRLHSYNLTPQSVERLLELVAGEPVVYEAFVNGFAYADADYVADPVKYGATSRSIHYLQTSRHPEPDIIAFIRQHIAELDSIDLVIADEAVKAHLWALLEKELPDVYITSSAKQWLEISHKDAGKHSGVRFVTEQLGISPNQAAAFGDGDNDADMLSLVGCGIAVANATPACMAAAKHVTKAHYEDGVAHGIYEILGI